MSSTVVPRAAVGIALAWFAAQLLDLPLLTVIVVVAAIGLTAGIAATRGPRPGFRPALAAVLTFMATTLFLLLGPLSFGPRALATQLAMVLGLGIATPLVYAATFPRRGGSDDTSCGGS